MLRHRATPSAFDHVERLNYQDDFGKGAWAHRLPCGSIISVYDGTDEAITALTDNGIDELRQMLAHARPSTDEWNDFLDSFVDDEELVARIKEKSPR
ncbi:hypothetical protein [Mesorhizobium sp. M1163]|uniref:hypothetical protein n=1 Tax=Mesorhizobium sp. M1163 TaxID=2957065 RepID=UPI00333DDC46